MLRIEPKSFSTRRPEVPIFCSSPPFAPAACWRRGVPESSPATLSVPTSSVCGMLTRVISISVLALEGGAIIPSQIASPDNLLAATVPSMASTGVSLSSSNHSRNILSVSSIGEFGPGPGAADGAGPAAGGGGGGGGGGGDCRAMRGCRLLFRRFLLRCKLSAGR